MRSSLRPALSVPAAAGLLAAAPAQARDAQGVLTEAEAYVGHAGHALAAHAHALASGDMPAIQLTSFVLSGLVAVIGLWLLLVSPRRPLDDHGEEVLETEAAETVSADGDADRPARLLEAIAAAKAQMSISQAEKKHAR